MSSGSKLKGLATGVYGIDIEKIMTAIEVTSIQRLGLLRVIVSRGRNTKTIFKLGTA